MNKYNPFIRWCIRRDLDAVMEIEKSVHDPWKQEWVIDCLREKDCIAMVAEVDEKVLGYMLYRLKPSYLYLYRFGVHVDHRHSGLGTQMLDKMKSKIIMSTSRKSIRIDVREKNLDLQLFLKKCKFKAIRVLRNDWSDTGEDTYRFTFRKSQCSTMKKSEIYTV